MALWRRRVILSCHLGGGADISEGLGCVTGMSFSDGRGIPSSQALREGEAEERGMLL